VGSCLARCCCRLEAGAAFKIDLSGVSKALATVGNLANQILTAAQFVVDVALRLLNGIYIVVVEVKDFLDK
jgi:hypothetical protein